MKRKSIIIGIVALLVCVGLSGCNQVSNTLNPEKSKFVGTWASNISLNLSFTPNLVLFSDGTCSYAMLGGSSPGTWDLKDNKLVIQLTGSLPYMYTYGYQFSNNDRTLILSTTGGMSAVYTKQ